MVKFFYGDCVLIFSTPLDKLPEGFTELPAGGSFAKMIENLEKYKQLAVVSDDAGVESAWFMGCFEAVDAAGGVVENPHVGELLMIYRNGRWDLPKGHREKEEGFIECALREVREETGICAKVKDLVPEHVTFHFYSLNGVWTMKRTAWYRMVCLAGVPSPQTEEGITSVEWVPMESVADKSVHCFPSVNEVLEVAGYL